MSVSIDRVLAPNPSPMTERGTNSYVVGGTVDCAVIDPGPANPDHLDAIKARVGARRVRAVLITHPHLDHSAGASPLAADLGAPICAFGPPEAGRSPTMRALSGLAGGEGVDLSFSPDRQLGDGEEVSGDGWSLTAIWTPGHMASHLSFQLNDQVFTGDVIMGWASTMISPPDGDIGQFLATLERVERLEARMLHPGHGDPVTDPAQRLTDLRAHRLGREAAILASLAEAQTIPRILDRVYADTPRALHAAAARNILAHLVHLVEKGQATADRLAPDGTFRRA
ncbi:MBL fold metallo-hydrolase [Jannaschia aquimarina]|uniref:GloB_2 protein n=1 Tax=Jannaschia aquimarina TaxID=935700 RepID=A0A0D1EN94_9RHOB|nr:MBL fold metallo-hydrolase [Jannaschia aquimarina]KIT17160.1 Hydroxyacylglutathione hydrolase [Jannaschia aquimarina]SNT17562.1 hydroxyacylglutathione hydrolase [Jannaschia aquimarina]